MRNQHVRNHNGEVKAEYDDDWPHIIVEMSPSERVIYTVDCETLILQFRTRNLRGDKWSRWQLRWKTKSHEVMRKMLEKSYYFASDSEKLDAIIIKTDDGDYVEHSR